MKRIIVRSLSIEVKVVVALVLTQFFFGINYIASKYILVQVNPIDWGMIRFGMAGFFLLTSAALFHKKNRKPFATGISYWVGLIILSFLGIALAQLSFLVGISKSSATNAAIMSSLIPIFTLSIVLISGREKLTWTKAWGILLSFMGVLILRNGEDFRLSNETFVGDLILLGSTFVVALYIVYCKTFFQKYDHWWSTGLMFIVALIITVPFGTNVFELWERIPLNPLMFSVMMISIVFGTLLTYFLSNWAIIHTESSNVSHFIYLQPIIVSILAWPLLGEILTVRKIIAILLIGSGFWFALFLPKAQSKNHIIKNS